MRTLAALCLLALAGLARPADLALASRVDAVTVYPSSARVTRVARATLPAGDVRLLLPGATDQLLDDSLRVEGRGAAAARIFGVTVERVTGAQAVAGEARAAQERLDRLLDQDRALEDEAKGALSRREFLDSLRSTYSEERAKNLAVRGVSAKEWAEMLAFVARERSAAAAEARKAERARRDLEPRIRAARADLEKLQAKRSTTTKTLALDLRAERGGTFEVEVSYLVPSAGWRPVWDARLDPREPSARLALHASVAQTSGEDWSGVRLAVSTAQPGRGLRVPELSPRWLDRRRPRAEPLPAAPAARAPERKALDHAELASAEEPAVTLRQAPAEVEQGLLSASFVAPRRETVDGAGQARKVFLADFPLAAEVSRTAAPRVDPAAYLTAKLSNDTGVPLLPGEASVFLQDEFVGRTRLPATPLGGELTLAFGADERVKIERRVVERRHETSGVFSKDDVWLYRTRTAVKNLYPVPVTVRLLDLVPVSRDEEIQVKLLDGSTAPGEPEDPMKPGVRAYVLTLRPKEEKAVELRYRVSFPRGMDVGGLE